MSRLGVRFEKLLRALATPRKQGPVRRLLVAHNLLLGDTVLLAPLLKSLAALYPEAERFILVRPAAAPLFENHPYGFAALLFERRDAASQRRILRSGPYDLAIVPDDNRYAWLARGAGARWIAAFAGDSPAWKNWMVDEAIDYSVTPAAWTDMAARLGDAASPEPFAAGEWAAPAPRAFDRPSGLYAVLHVGASTPLKLWPAARWRSVADALTAEGLAIVWSGGRGEEALVDAVGVRAGEMNLAGRLDLAQLWHLLAAAQLLVVPDTGITHLARLTGVPTLALFGPGSVVVHGAGEFFARVPYRALTLEDFPCRDQKTLYRRPIEWVRRCGRAYGTEAHQCPHGRCMYELPEERVRTAALELLRHGRS